MNDKEYLERLKEVEKLSSADIIDDSEYRIARALEIIARCLIKSDFLRVELSDGAIKQTQDTIKEVQKNINKTLNPVFLKSDKSDEITPDDDPIFGSI